MASRSSTAINRYHGIAPPTAPPVPELRHLPATTPRTLRWPGRGPGPGHPPLRQTFPGKIAHRNGGRDAQPQDREQSGPEDHPLPWRRNHRVSLERPPNRSETHGQHRRSKGAEYLSCARGRLRVPCQRGRECDPCEEPSHGASGVGRQGREPYQVHLGRWKTRTAGDHRTANRSAVTAPRLVGPVRKIRKPAIPAATAEAGWSGSSSRARAHERSTLNPASQAA